MGFTDTLQHWSKGIRLYLAAGIGLVSLQVWWWASLVYTGDPDLIAARTHEIFGWLALLMLAVTLSVGPLYKLAPKLGGVKPMRDARRMLGIAAAWFASLHVLISFFVSLKAVNPLELTGDYRQAFATGIVALLILLAMAFTSFNAAMRSLGKWWFRLHRFVYLAVALALWHAYTIGVHAVSLPALTITVGAAMLLFVSHVHLALQQPAKPSRWQIATLAAVFIAIVVLSNYGIQQYIDLNSLQGHG